MGIYAGPAPWPELQALSDGQQGEWGVDWQTWRVLNNRHRYPADPSVLYGMSVRIDDTLPAGTIDLRNHQGECIGRITGLAHENTNKQTPRPPIEAQQPPRRIAPPIQQLDGDAWVEAEYEKRINSLTRSQQRRIAALNDEPPPVFTGPTTRLVSTCRACGDTLPDGAIFCISCGEPAHAPA